MQSPYSPINVAFAILTLGAVGIAVWLARWLMQVASAQKLPWFPYPLPRRRGAALLLWMMLSALMFIPLNDTLRMLQSLPSILLPQQWIIQTPAATSWGNAPWPLYLILLDLVLVVAYAIPFFAVRGIARGGDQGLSANRQSQVGLLLLSLGGGGLLARFAQAFIIGVVWFPFGGGREGWGIGGFLVGWLVALIVLGAASATMWRRPILDADDKAAAF